ncbi:MAG: hypothetical protein JO096_02095 [Alphaproteobacteria bacterium]|nr:hypothetical protein [Alphaproteobacteria bacterium]
MRRPTLLAGCVATAVGILAGCSESRITGSSEHGAAHGNDTRAEVRTVEVRPGKAEIGKRFASAALDDSQLGGVRGGMTTSSGMVVNFAFQEATYVNHNLTQSIIVPTITFSPGSGQPATASIAAGASAVAGIATTTQAQVRAPSQVVQSVVNNGMTSVVSSLGGGGITNHITNAANNQLVQQVITANIGITGLGQAIQQSVASTVMSRVQAAASAQFR